MKQLYSIMAEFTRNHKESCTFFGKNYADEEIVSVVSHVEIEKFRNHPMVNTLSPFT